MFTSLTLSTGKTIQIPIFNNAGITGVEVISRANAVLRVYEPINESAQYYITSYDRVTDAELKELGCIILGKTDPSTISLIINKGAPPYPYTTNNGINAMLLFWCYYPNSNTYILSHPFDYTGDSNTISANARAGFGLGYPQPYAVSEDYYNSENPNPLQGAAYHNYWDYVAYRKSIGTANRNAANIRSGGIYTLDIICSPERNDLRLTGYAAAESTIYDRLEDFVEDNPDSGITWNDSSAEWPDPYGNIISQPGGGDGDPSVDPSNIEKASIPALPSLSAVDAGMITMYYCTNAQLRSLASYLWSNIYDLETNFVKLFSNPMDCIIGLGIVPVMPQLGSASNVNFGNIDTNIFMTKLSSQFQEKDMGTVSIPKWIGCFLDYSPYVKISLYLPYIGYRELSADDVVGDSIHVVYHIDCLTGGCCAFVETGKKGLLYTFNGSCIANVPLTATNYSTAIQNAVSAVGAGLTTVAGIATGAAPLTAVGATSMLSSASNTALNSKPSIQRSGAMGGAAGLMSNQTPMLIIERPRPAVPENLNQFRGNTFYVTRKLDNVHGYTVIDLINLDGIPCTSSEKNELENILKQGVIF